MQTNPQGEIRSTFQKFQDGYTARDGTKCDEFMQLFVQDESIDMIGVGDLKRAASLVYHYENASQPHILRLSYSPNRPNGIESGSLFAGWNVVGPVGLDKQIYLWGMPH
jgi:hypothetical protein